MEERTGTGPGRTGEIQTERLALRPVSAADVHLLVALDADPEVRRHVDEPSAPSPEEVLARMPRLLERYGASHEPAFWIAEHRPSGSFCGWFHLRPLEGDATTLDLDYRLAREFWSQGLASEGARALVDRAFRVLSADRVVAHALESNTASGRVLVKAGLREHGRYLHRGALPAVAYGVSREQYRGGPA